MSDDVDVWDINAVYSPANPKDEGNPLIVSEKSELQKIQDFYARPDVIESIKRSHKFNDIPVGYPNPTPISDEDLAESVKTIGGPSAKYISAAASAASNSFKIPGVADISLAAEGAISSATDMVNGAVASVTTKASEMSKMLGGFGASKQASSGNAGSSMVKQGSKTEEFMVQLRSKQSGAVVRFNVSPTIDESRAANYEHIAPIHHPGTIQVYKNSESRQFNITAKLIARTQAEATINIRYLNQIRGWLMPYYGQGTANSSEKERLGGPPDILVLNAYGLKNIASVPVVLTSYHWVYPDQVDYIPTTEGIPCPTIMDISLSLIESFSPEEHTRFDITSYRQGDMTGAYSFSTTPVASEQSSGASSNSVSDLGKSIADDFSSYGADLARRAEAIKNIPGLDVEVSIIYQN